MSRREAGALGGRARAAKLSPAERERIARSGGRAYAENLPSERQREILDAAIQKIVDRAPKLTAAQRAKIQAALANVPAPASQEAVGQ